MFPYYLRQRQTPAAEPRRARKSDAGPAFFRVLRYTIILIVVGVFGATLLPGMPNQYNILAPLDVTAPASPLSKFKIARATKTPEQCLALLETVKDVRYARLLDRQTSDECHIQGHVQVRGLSKASMPAVSTTCETTLRLYLWERNSLQRVARDTLGAEIRQIDHLSSYSCRKVRTDRGEGAEMSAHATASAIDITGITLTDGRRLDVLNGWGNGDPMVRTFWRRARTTACDWFGTVLSPDFNELHRDHLHLGQDRYGACK